MAEAHLQQMVFFVFNLLEIAKCVSNVLTTVSAYVLGFSQKVYYLSRNVLHTYLFWYSFMTWYMETFRVILS